MPPGADPAAAAREVALLVRVKELLAQNEALRGAEAAGSTAWLTWPPFASCISIELWAPPPAAGDAAPLQPHFVRVLYDQRVLAMPCAAGPHGACRLSDFASSLQRLIPVDYAAECH